ncbi:hypothetical protein KKB10_00380 [Patescibacteria group bacterium]|nr:hypothetical protein [Patescibacteria group bacterium]MBU1075181.1 hypothetical protein [Patescibacteria group bacterium]MBU1951975.1 hypothetical protein [Patescibacteria group bacterium]
MKKILFIFILFFLSIGFSSQALACKCELLDTSDAYSKADVVFSGIVASFFDREGSEQVYKDAEFVVYDSWKGNDNDPRIVTVGTSVGSSMCGYSFTEGKEYLIYATITEDGKMYTSTCDGTKLLSESENEQEVLEKIQYETANTPAEAIPVLPEIDTVIDPSSEKTEPSSNGTLVIGMAIIGVLAIGLLIGTIFYFSKKK